MGGLINVAPRWIYYFPRSSTNQYFMSKTYIRIDPPVKTSVLWL